MRAGPGSSRPARRGSRQLYPNAAQSMEMLMIRGLIQRNWVAPTGFTIWALLLVWAEVASAQQPVEPAGPREVVAQATDRIMALVREAPDYFEDDPDRYINGVGEELDRVVDFRGFARGVMGSYASAERYRSLDKACLLYTSDAADE